MEEITSVANNKIKEAVKLSQKKYRNEKGLFLIEGAKPIKEGFDSGVEFVEVYTLRKFLPKFDFVKEKITLVSEHVLAKISTTESVPEAVAVAKQKSYSLKDIKNSKRILLIENIKDAGNLGTLVRSACAFSMDAVVLCGDTVDIYNPKVVRSTVGAIFKLPIVKTTLENMREIFSNSKFIASVVNQTDVVNPEKIDYTSPFVLLLGSEAVGLSEKAIAIADVKTTIPISQQTESLNLATAGAVLLYICSK